MLIIILALLADCVTLALPWFFWAVLVVDDKAKICPTVYAVFQSTIPLFTYLLSSLSISLHHLAFS